MNITNKLFLTIILLILSSNVVQAVTMEGQIYDYQLNELNNVLVEINTVPSQQFLSLDGTYSFELDEGEYILKANREDLITEETIIIDGDDEGKFLYDLFLFPNMGDEDDLWDDLGDLEYINDTKSSVEDSRTWAYVITIIIFLIAFLRIFKAKKKYKRGKWKNKNKNETTNIKLKLKEDLDVNNGDRFKIDDNVDLVNEIEEKVVKSGEDTFIILENNTIIEPEKFTKEEALASIDEEQPGYITRTIDIIKNHDGRITQKELRKELMELSESKVSLILTELEHKNIVEKVKRGRGNVILLKEKLKK